MEAYPSIEHWYLGGHSLGGVAASSYAAKNEDKLDGLIFLASYPSNKLNTIRVLSIYGTNDGVLNKEAYEKARDNFSSNTKEQIIDGANHAQFGSYGLQKGDGEASISPTEQVAITCKSIKEFTK